MRRGLAYPSILMCVEVYWVGKRCRLLLWLGMVVDLDDAC